MLKVSSFSESSDKTLFIKRFSLIGEQEDYLLGVIQLFGDLKHELYIIHDDQKDLGRISANISHNESTAYFGMLYCLDENQEVLETLLEKAQSWSSDHGASLIIGPIDFNVWLSYRVKTNAYEDKHFWEPSYSKFYYEGLVQSGFLRDKTYFSYFYENLETCFNRTQPSFKKATEQGYKFIEMDLSDERALKQIYEMNINGFNESYLYSPLSFEQYTQAYLKYIKKVDLRFSCLVVSPNNEKLGYIYSIPDGDYILVKSIVLKPEVRGAKLSSALVHYTMSKARENGYLKTGGSMVRQGNSSEHFFNHLGTPEKKHEYVLLKKELKS